MTNNKKPLISIILPNYNNEKYLSEAIESVLNQTYDNFELIIIDDFSSDNSLRIINNYLKKDRRIKLYKNKKNLGIVKTLNKGLYLSKGEYIGRMDGDDVIVKNKFEKQIDFLLQNPQYVGVGTGIMYCDVNLKKLGVRIYPSRFKEIKKKLLFEPPFAHATILIKSEIYKKFKYSLKSDFAEDYDLWFRILKKYKMSNLKDITYIYRQYEEQGKVVSLKKTLKRTIKVKSKYLFMKDYFNIFAISYLSLELFLLLLPKRVILFLFFLIKFKNK